MEEKRKHKRIKLREGFYGYRTSGRIGEILNVSAGGMLCRCSQEDICDDGAYDIFCPGNSICLSGVPVKSVSSSQQSSSSSPGGQARRCHLKFDESQLTAKKNFELKVFLDAYLEDQESL